MSQNGQTYFKNFKFVWSFWDIMNQSIMHKTVKYNTLASVLHRQYFFR